METCTKVFKREVIQAIELTEDRFGFEPEITREIGYSIPLGYGTQFNQVAARAA